ncbi:MAG: porin family protein, partial [Sphingomonas sp.]|nr:porin family protein [Sphingomonas sp.]
MLATTLVAAPAMARDKTLYLGVEAGPMWASDLDINVDTPEGEFDFFELDHKMGYDVGVIFGYDAGIVRAELDLSYKRASHDELVFDGEEGTFAEDADGHSRYIAIMTNLLLDVGDEDGLSFYAGPGAGFAWGKFDLGCCDGEFSEDVEDGGVAWQLIAGMRYALNPNVDLGVKYRYFRPSRIRETLDAEDDVIARG